MSSPINNQELTRKAIEAIERHFDGKVTSFKVQDNLSLIDLKNSSPIDIFVVIDEYEGYNLEAQETWIY